MNELFSEKCVRINTNKNNIERHSSAVGKRTNAFFQESCHFVLLVMRNHTNAPTQRARWQRMPTSV